MKKPSFHKRQDIVEYAVTLIQDGRTAVQNQRGTTAFQGSELATWPLFLPGRNGNADSIDTCATALGVISACNCSSRGSLSEQDRQNAEEGTKTLIRLRNEDGSWPSNVMLLARGSAIAQGVTSDTYYALSALLAAGFLDEDGNPALSRLLNEREFESFANLEKRYAYISTSVEWLNKSRIRDGWFYTKQWDAGADEAPVPQMMPTANVMSLYVDMLHKVGNRESGLALELEKALVEATRLVASLQDPKSGGFGLCWGSKPSVTGTARALLALSKARAVVGGDLSSELDLDGITGRALKWLYKRYRPGKAGFKDVCESFDQAIFSTKTKEFYTHLITHETFTEPLVISAVNEFVAQRGDKWTAHRKHAARTVKRALRDIGKRQEDSGQNRGLIRSRQQNEERQYPIYATVDMICALAALVRERSVLTHLRYMRRYSAKPIITTALIVVALTALAYLLSSSILGTSITAAVTVIMGIVSNFLYAEYLS